MEIDKMMTISEERKTIDRLMTPHDMGGFRQISKEVS
jgi:hypothetical protein